MKRLLVVLIGVMLLSGCVSLSIGSETAEDLCKQLSVEYDKLSDQTQMFLENKLPTAKKIAEAYRPLTVEEKISLLEGKITLLEMKLINKKDKK